MLLPHTLEFATDPYAIVREVDRVLVGEGRLLVLGFRPWSLWGIARRCEPQWLSAQLRRVLSERRVRDGWCCSATKSSPSASLSLFASPWAAAPKGEGNGAVLQRAG